MRHNDTRVDVFALGATVRTAGTFICVAVRLSSEPERGEEGAYAARTSHMAMATRADANLPRLRYPRKRTLRIARVTHPT